MAGETIKITSKDGGTFDAYLAKPESGSGPGVVVIQEIFGITPWVKEMTDMLAAQGYFAAAPDMFWRLEPNFTADPNTEDGVKAARTISPNMDMDLAVEDIGATATAMKALPGCNGKIGTVGFCMGGTLAYLSATRLDVDAAVSYYGTKIHLHLDEGKNITCPTILHMAEHEHAYSKEDGNNIHAALIGIPNVAIYMYDAKHAFANSHRPDFYSQGESAKAHQRTYELFNSLK